MKVFNLACEDGHGFEGWFSSAEDYDSQKSRGLLNCPICNSASVTRMPSAPRLNLGHATDSAQPRQSGSLARVEPGRDVAEATPAGFDPRSATKEEWQAMALKFARHVMATTEDVGARFAEEARRIHHQEAPERAIRGQVTPDEAGELLDEGIAVFPIPMADVAKETLQ